MKKEISIAKQLLSDAREGFIDPNHLLESCLKELERSGAIYDFAIEEGYIGAPERCVSEVIEERTLEDLDVQQRIIEKVLGRHGE